MSFGPRPFYSDLHRGLRAGEHPDQLRPDAAAPPENKPVTLETLFAGFSYIRSRPIVLGAISLDLFAMLLGGVTALLPIYAKDVLETGPWGLGLLRSAPAIGALLVSIVLAHYPLDPARRARSCSSRPSCSGSSIIVFAFSTSLAALDRGAGGLRRDRRDQRRDPPFAGAVQHAERHARPRAGGEFMFTGTSGTLGEFRAGAVAAAFGAFTSVLIGGVGAILVALLWMRLFPDLRRVDAMQSKIAQSSNKPQTGPRARFASVFPRC